MIPPFSEHIDKGRIFVEPPTKLVFLCGGKTQPKQAAFASIRDAFLKIEDNPILKDKRILLAENVNTFHLSRPAYNDLLEFEIDFAQLCEVIVLFSESQGSIAELGAFSMMPELSAKLLVVIRDYHLKEDSFIKLGPLKHLTRKYGDHAQFILNDDETGMKNNSIKNLDLGVLKDRIVPAIEERIGATRERTTFNRERRGHIIKLMVGLVQEFGGLTAAEIVALCADFAVQSDIDDVDRLMLCAEAAEWVKKEQRGFHSYYFALPEPKAALVLRFNKGSPIFDSLRRKEAFRDHWKVSDPQRFSGIVKYAGVSA